MTSIEHSEKTASETCTRSGAFALLISLALISLVPTWSHRKDSLLVGRYMILRLNIVTALEELDDNPSWQKYKLTHDTESVSMVELVNLNLNAATIEPLNAQSTSPSAETRPTPVLSKSGGPAPHVASPAGTPVLTAQPINSPQVPDSPTGLTAVVAMQFQEIDDLAKFLGELNTDDFVSRVRSASGYFDVSIYRWLTKRASLMNRNLAVGRPKKEVVVNLDRPGSPIDVNFKAERYDFLNYLTLGDVRQLAKTELPPISNTVKLGGDENEVQLTESSLPKNLEGASVLAQVLLLFIIMYFAAFTREAVLEKNFPTKGTLFGAFAGSLSTLAVMFGAICTPLIASIAVAVAFVNNTSKWVTLSLFFSSALVGSAVFYVLRLLNGKSYFEPLVKKARWKNVGSKVRTG